MNYPVYYVSALLILISSLVARITNDGRHKPARIHHPWSPVCAHFQLRARRLLKGRAQ